MLTYDQIGYLSTPITYNTAWQCFLWDWAYMILYVMIQRLHYITRLWRLVELCAYGLPILSSDNSFLQFLVSGMPSQLQYCCNLLQPFGWHVSYIDTMWLCVFSFQSFCSVPLTQLVQKKWRKSKAIGKASPHQCHTNVISSWNFLQCALALR